MDCIIKTIARAIIIRNERILLLQVDDGKGRWWILPGGKQEFGESLADTVRRECIEELGSNVLVGECMFVREFIGAKRQTVVGNVKHQHSVEVFFDCELVASTIDAIPRDVHHKTIEWVDLKMLPMIQMFPKTLSLILADKMASRVKSAVYLGDAD